MSVPGIFDSFDRACFSFFGSIQNGTLTDLAGLFRLEGNAVLIAVAALLIFLCMYKKTRRIGIALVLALLIGALISNAALKPLIARERPYTALAGDAEFMGWFSGAGSVRAADSSYSFPSGHMTSFTAMAAVLLIAHLRSGRKAAKAVCWVFPVLAALFGLSRVYLMVHYMTDIIGGAVIGAAAGVLGYFIADMVYKRLFGKRTL